MQQIVLDLEMNQPSGRIIQIGAVCGNLETGVITHSLNLYIDPKEKLNPEISKLTGIKEGQLKKSLKEEIHTLENFLNQVGFFGEPMIWGTKDVLELKKQVLSIFPESKLSLFPNSWIDVRSLFFLAAKRRGLPENLSLSLAMRALGLVFYGRRHHALHDAQNTFVLAHHLLKNA